MTWIPVSRKTMPVEYRSVWVSHAPGPNSFPMLGFWTGDRWLEQGKAQNFRDPIVAWHECAEPAPYRADGEDANG